MSTGLPEFDNVLQGVRPGDNIVWQVVSINDYVPFVDPFCRKAFTSGNQLIYFRFADHSWLLPDDIQYELFELHPEKGFEFFIDEIFKVIEKFGRGVFYVFDCLSELSVDWYSDRMLGNFFRLTCPYLYDYDTATYFALLRDHHTTHTIKAIHNTAQVIIDVYRNEEEIYIQPLKVDKRFTPTMYSLHHWKNSELQPVTKSIIVSKILKGVTHPWLDFTKSIKDMWIRTFIKADEIVHAEPENRTREYDEYFNRLLRMVVTRDEQLLSLAERYFDLTDLIDIGKHMIGTGLIGGKAVGMLLSRAILTKKCTSLRDKVEPHDSFFIGSDVFYTYLINSGSWWARWRLRNTTDMMDKAEEIRQRLLSGTFPDDIIEQLTEVLNYFGQSPFIVRSSSLLEDAYGNSFSGKYESVFCTNQGTPEDRLESFINAIRTVYASTMDEDALLYRAQRKLLNRDEQMALLVQRVSGAEYGDYYFPQIAGVGFSFNPYVWSKDIDPKTGVIRLVFGLGTRAVDRHDDDYTRIVSLSAPEKRPEVNFDEVKKYAQRKVDLLDLKNNKQTSGYFHEITKVIDEADFTFFATRDSDTHTNSYDRQKGSEYWVLTFNELLSKTEFIKDMDTILATLQESYHYPVDIEFAANFIDKNHYKINLLQCRPFQVKREIQIVEDPGEIREEDIILKTSGPIIGPSTQIVIDRIIYVKPEGYGLLPMTDRYSIARLMGRLMHLENKSKHILLIGPGRWCTSSPSLGITTKFQEINTATVLCEVAEMHERLIPDVSLGTHFFNDLVELDMLYIAIYPGQIENSINKKLLNAMENNLKNQIPEAQKYEHIVMSIDCTHLPGNKKVFINANTVEQKAVCFLGQGQE